MTAGEATHAQGGLDLRKTAMWAFLGSECLFFGALISTFLLYRNRFESGPGPEIFDVPFTSVSSFVLLMSSLTMVLAHNAAGRNDRRQLQVWLAATALLGLVFLSGQVFEFTSFAEEGLVLGSCTAEERQALAEASEIVREEDGPRRCGTPFSSSFYLLTGTHGAHVMVGVLMLSAMFILARRGSLSSSRGMNVELIGLYWHFVDIVWIVIFTLVYLLQI